MLSGFILASVLIHLPQKADVERVTQASVPDLSPGRARSNNVGYMPGVTPSLVLFIVSGTTRPLRLTMYERFVLRSLGLRRRQDLRPSTPRGDHDYPYYAITLQGSPFLRQRSESSPQSPQPLSMGPKSKTGLRIDRDTTHTEGIYSHRSAAMNVGINEVPTSPCWSTNCIMETGDDRPSYKEFKNGLETMQ